MKKLEMEYGPFIYTIIMYLMFWIRFRKESVILRLRKELNTFARDLCSYNSLQGHVLKYKHYSFFLLLKIVLLYTKFCLGLFFYTTSTFVCSSPI